MKKATKTTSTADSNNGERIEGMESSATQKAKVAANRKTPSTQKKITETANAVNHVRRSNPAPGSGADNLVCRYCGSDDLAPSFIRGRDARCRACFKQRYGSGRRNQGKMSSAA